MIVFMLGTPGCGKSEIYRRLTKRLKEDGLYSDFNRVDDFPKLWDIFMKDEESGKWNRSRPTDDGGYKVTDNTVWDDILKEVNSDVEKMNDESGEDTLLFVEFSRPNYVHSIKNNFSGTVLEKALSIYLDVPFEVCWERNVRRHEQALEAGSDDHLVSRDEMEETYGSDDKEKLKDDLGIPVVFVSPDERDPDATKKLTESVDKAYNAIKEYAKN
ncbi:MAG: AAA family ATPase [Elusimicrobia bacterium]|jgi:adenylate kinase family enzyme|nr:AAA family ATPase [Elusimicrobiota bacterium]